MSIWCLCQTNKKCTMMGGDRVSHFDLEWRAMQQSQNTLAFEHHGQKGLANPSENRNRGCNLVFSTAQFPVSEKSASFHSPSLHVSFALLSWVTAAVCAQLHLSSVAAQQSTSRLFQCVPANGRGYEQVVSKLGLQGWRCYQLAQCCLGHLS